MYDMLKLLYLIIEMLMEQEFNIISYRLLMSSLITETKRYSRARLHVVKYNMQTNIIYIRKFK